jgi:hypothetical protein
MEDKENLLAVSDYVTDMFQRLYHAEVRNGLKFVFSQGLPSLALNISFS